MSTITTSASDRYAAARRALAAYESRPVAEMGEPDPIRAEMASALRALIEPPATAETPEAIVERIINHHVQEVRMWSTPQIVLAAVRAGIQAAWETWEPETAPTIDDNADLIEDLRQIRDQRGDWRGVLDSLIGDDE